VQVQFLLHRQADDRRGEDALTDGGRLEKRILARLAESPHVDGSAVLQNCQAQGGHAHFLHGFGQASSPELGAGG